MQMMACQIHCDCGGHVVRLPEDGVYYYVTEKRTIVFRGHCNLCNEIIGVERLIESLLLMTPIEGQGN